MNYTSSWCDCRGKVLYHSWISSHIARNVSDSKRLITSKSNGTPELSVVLPTHDEQRGVVECIESIIDALTVMKLSGEIIVVNSSDAWIPDIAAMSLFDDTWSGVWIRLLVCIRANPRWVYVPLGNADRIYSFTGLPKPAAVVHDGDADMLLGSRLNSEIRADTMSPPY